MPKNKFSVPRLLHLVSMLKKNVYPNHPRLLREMRALDIAGAYEITQKTFQRDISFLKIDCRAPLAYDYTRKGYYLLDPDWSLDAPSLREPEREAAVLGARIAEKLLPDPIAGKIRKSVETLLGNDSGVPDERSALLSLIVTGGRTPIKREIFEAVFQGWRTRHALWITYTRAQDGVTADLLVEPHLLAFHEGTWYLKIRLLKASRILYETKNVLTLAVHRISRVTPALSMFDTDLNLVQKCNAGYLFDLPRVRNVCLLLTGKAAIYGPETFPGATLIREKDDILRMEIPETEEYRVRNFVMSWCGDAVVSAPESLRKEICAAGRKIWMKHEEKTPSENDPALEKR